MSDDPHRIYLGILRRIFFAERAGTGIRLTPVEVSIMGMALLDDIDPVVDLGLSERQAKRFFAPSLAQTD